MNERFFDLKKDRQDRIINGAMRIFAENGYRHASTDEMVAAAGISKGLLFHYFKSKKGTWMFLYEYCTRYMLIEMREAERRHGCDFFDMYRQLVKADESVLRRYPWVPIFLKRADREFDLIKADPEEFPEDMKFAVASRRAALLAEAAKPPFLSEEDAVKVTQMLEYTRLGLLQELLAQEGAEEKDGEDPEEELSLPLSQRYTDRLSGYLRTLRRMNL